MEEKQVKIPKSLDLIAQYNFFMGLDEKARK